MIAPPVQSGRGSRKQGQLADCLVMSFLIVLICLCHQIKGVNRPTKEQLGLFTVFLSFTFKIRIDKKRSKMRGGDHIVSFPGICKMTEKMLN